MRIAVLAACATLAICGRAGAQTSQAREGAALIAQIGCGACHSIPGIDGATGNVGPPLDRIGSRIFIAGYLHNTPDNLALWIMHPQQIAPGNAMPDLGIDRKAADQISAYLETLR